MRTSIKKIILAIFSLVLSYQIYGQYDSLENERIESWQNNQFFTERANSRYNLGPLKESIYTLMNRMVTANEDSYYFTFAHTSQRSESIIPPFRTEQGELKRSILELRLVDRFNVIKFDNKVSNDFWSRARFLYVNYDFSYRIGKRNRKDSIRDSPGLPLNTIFGFTIYEQILNLNKAAKWGKYRKPKNKNTDGVSKPDSISTNTFSSQLFSKNNLRFLVARFDFMHYSNGQDFGATITDSLTMSIRNDYLTGNFSTNYVEARLRYMETNRDGELLDFEAGIRRDIALGEFLTYEEAQKGRYGRVFLNLNFQYRTGPRRIFWNLRDPVLLSQKRNWSKENRKAYKSNLGSVEGLGEIAFKISSQHTFNKLKKLPSENGFKYRNGIDLKIEYIPLFSPEWSFFVGAYYGRDFLNIRYDLPILLIKGGISFQVNRYRPSTASMIKKLRKDRMEYEKVTNNK